ncbi:MAG: cell division ATP-binding protein FtsE [Desulfobulbaceae bacterium]|uniref:Cell division ATP-binding protein FtsE n=1 Tax=Candidatus Desulfobia pelagia TaxID=2841692 RepID=A0A8J6TGL7_9BACT|nr:cell division ATP-binding protein FtsE [Candidatus Desulfobia pelagia]
MTTHPSENDKIVDIVKVTKIYPPDVMALRDISLTARRGELIFLTGASGAGKTTLLKLLTCLERPTKGVIEIGGNDINTLTSKAVQKLRQRIGVAYQDFRLLPKQTVFQNIAMAMEVRFKSPKEIKQRVDELLEMLAITDKRNNPSGKLSRGEQQRVAIARAAANAPPLILADEPTGNLDDESTARVMSLFSQLNSQGSTIIIATHDASIYKNTHHRLLHLQHGQITEKDTV